MTHHIFDFPPRVPNSVTRVNAGLDFTSALALQYIKKSLSQVGALNVPTALIVRRALTRYAEALTRNAMPTDPHVEGGILAALVGAMSHPGNDESQQQTLKDQRQQQERLDSAPQGEPLPPFGDVIWGFGHTAEAKRFRAECMRELADPYGVHAINE